MPGISTDYSADIHARCDTSFCSVLESPTHTSSRMEIAAVATKSRAERQPNKGVTGDRLGGPVEEEEVLQEDRRTDVDDRQPGPFWTWKRSMVLECLNRC